MNHRDFEDFIKNIINKKYNIELKKNFPLNIGINSNKKIHKFDLGCEKNKILIECKFHMWTVNSNAPSAKMSIWNEAMFFFSMVPSEYKKILVVKKSNCINKKESLAQYYARNYYHLIPEGVEIWECNVEMEGEILKILTT